MVLKMAMRHGDSLAARRPLRTVAVAEYSHVEAGPPLSTIDTRRGGGSSAAPRPLGDGRVGVRAAVPGKLPAFFSIRPASLAPRTKAVPAPAPAKPRAAVGAGERGVGGLDSAQTRAGSAAWQKQTTASTALPAAVRLPALQCPCEINIGQNSSAPSLYPRRQRSVLCVFVGFEKGKIQVREGSEVGGGQSASSARAAWWYGRRGRELSPRTRGQKEVRERERCAQLLEERSACSAVVWRPALAERSRSKHGSTSV